MPGRIRLSPIELKALLDEKADRYNRRDFIESDPISIPHLFTKKQDIEISGMFAAVMAWGQRTTIIRKAREVMRMMGDVPHDFVLNHSSSDLKVFRSFAHRTFQPPDVVYFVQFLKQLYTTHHSIEDFFIVPERDETVEGGLNHFRRMFVSYKHPKRTEKHIASPDRKSACKRLNMFLRWMVRSDNRGVDFGLWKKLSPSQLVCPCDIHVTRVARHLQLIRDKTVSWSVALDLTRKLKELDRLDPVKYDFALFGLGLEGSLD